MSEWTEEREAEVRARCVRATPGEWFYNSYSAIVSEALVDSEDSEDVVAFVPIECGDTATNCGALDADFIANARTDLPDALEEIERLRTDNTKLDEENQYASDLLAISQSEIDEQKAEVNRLRLLLAPYLLPGHAGGGPCEHCGIREGTTIVDMCDTCLEKMPCRDA